MKAKKFKDADELTTYLIKYKEALRKVKLKQINKAFELKIIDFGIAYSYDNVIEINHVLLEFPKLLKEVLEHELEHLVKPSFIDTLKIDFMDGLNFKKQKLLSSSLRKYPKMSFQSILPVWYHKGELCYNSFFLVIYPMLILIIFLIVNLVL